MSATRQDIVKKALREAASLLDDCPMRRPLTAAERRVSGPTLSFLGSSGVLRDANGLPRYDVAPEMQPVFARGLDADHGVFHEMARSDAAISGAMQALRKTIGRATYTVTAPPDESPAEREARELVCAFCGVSTDLGRPPESWPGRIAGGLTRHLYQAASAKVYGFAVFEVDAVVVPWRGRDVLVPSKVRWIAPWSVQRWLWSEEDELLGLTQVVRRNGASSKWPLRYSFGTREFIDIPASRLLLYVNQYADGNPEGTSDLRALWAPWMAKKGTMVRHEAGEEALFKGFAMIEPTGEPAAADNEEALEDLEEAVDELIDGNIKRLTVMAPYKVSLHHPEFDIKPPTAMLDWYNQQIFLGLSSLIYGLPSSHAGSASMSGEASEMMVSTLEQSTDDLLDTTNGDEVPSAGVMGLIARLLEWNFAPGTVRRRPRLSVLGFSNAAKLAQVLRELGQFRWLTPTETDEQVLRHRSKMPVETLEAIKERRAAAVGQSTQASQVGTQVGQ
jgi:hypothetical protein